MKKKLWMLLVVFVCMTALSLPQKACAEGAVHMRMDKMVKQKNNLYFADEKGIVTYNIKTKKQSRLATKKAKDSIYGMLYYNGNLYWSQYHAKKNQNNFYKINLKSKEKSCIYENVGDVGFIKDGRIYFDERLETYQVHGEAWLYDHAIVSVDLEGQDKQIHLNWTEEREPFVYTYYPFYLKGRYYFGEQGQYSVASDFTGKKKEKKGYEKACKAFKSNFSGSSLDFDGKLIYVDYPNYPDNKKPAIVHQNRKGKTTTVYQSKKKSLKLLACDYGYLVIKEGKDTILLNKKYKKVAAINK